MFTLSVMVVELVIEKHVIWSAGVVIVMVFVLSWYMYTLKYNCNNKINENNNSN